MKRYEVSFTFHDFEYEDAHFIVTAPNGDSAIDLAKMEYEDAIGRFPDSSPEIHVYEVIL